MHPAANLVDENYTLRGGAGQTGFVQGPREKNWINRRGAEGAEKKTYRHGEVLVNLPVASVVSAFSAPPRLILLLVGPYGAIVKSPQLMLTPSSAALLCTFT